MMECDGMEWNGMMLKTAGAHSLTKERGSPKMSYFHTAGPNFSDQNLGPRQAQLFRAQSQLPAVDILPYYYTREGAVGRVGVGGISE
jgi:hypothetical protein